MILTQEQEKLALEIAHKLNDMESLQWHRQIVEKYAEEHLRKKLMKALAVPQSQVRTTRGAIYNSLLRGYGNSRD